MLFWCCFSEFKCEICSRTIGSLLELRHHIALHQRNRINPVYKCDICNRRFTHQIQRDEHLQSKHKHLMEMCDICGEM